MMRLAPKLNIPNIATETVGIIGKRGSGKSHTGTLLVEELLDARVQTIVLDPTGGFWGLRAGADGKPKGGYSIPIFGGLHSDMPLQDGGGAVLAEYVVENRLSCVLDLSDFSKSAMRRFVRDFAEKLYVLKNKRRDPCHIVIDECDLFVPQRIDSQDMLPLVGAINDFVLRGRQRGIGVTLISQRPARINKDVLTQVEILIAFRLTGPQDIDAFGDWIEHNGSKADQKRVLATLSSLERGTGWFWAPGLMSGMLKCVSFRERHTFDSSRTPDGKKVKPPKTLADVDLGELSEAMKATIEKAKTNDPKLLRAEVERLKRELQAKLPPKIQAAPAPTRLPKRVEVPALTPRQEKKIDALTKVIVELRVAYEAVVEKLRKEHDVVVSKADAAVAASSELRKRLRELASGKTSRAAEVSVLQSVNSRRPEVSKRAAPKGSNGEGSVKHPLICRKILIALAQHPDGLTKSQILLHAGYAASGPVSTSFADLVREGWVEPQRNVLVITRDGLDQLGDYEPLPTGDELREFLLNGSKLDGMERKLLAAICEVYPKEISKTEVLERSGYAASGPISTAFAKLVRYEYVESSGRSLLRASDALFSEAH